MPTVRCPQLDRKLSYLHVKRAMDVGLSIAAMPVVLPVLAVCAIAIRLDSPGPPLYVQERLGQHGKRFRLIKLRTMVHNADELKSSVLDDHTKHFKPRNDPRITRVGGFLRRTSLDELPQLFNVLKGEMSLVGPRPTSLTLVTYEPWHEARLHVRPGITGLWQVRGRNAMTFDERVQLDLEYIESLSFTTDLRLLFSTLGVVLRGTGA
jgi:lipopolysaccharide/colanic/teichoic acid biosynthesis glycosyltransferase